MVNVAQTDSFIATLIPRSSFQIAYTEEEMSADHDRAPSSVYVLRQQTMYHHIRETADR